MKLSLVFFAYALLLGCASQKEKWIERWASIPRGPDLTTKQVTAALGKPSVIRYETTRVFRYGPGGWFEGLVTIYRYNIKLSNGDWRYTEYYFDADEYLSGSTNIIL